MVPQSLKNIRTKAAEGEYTLVEPLDYLLLQKMREEGEMALGLYPLGDTTLAISKKFTPEQQKLMTSIAVASRMRVLHIQSLVRPVKSGLAESGKFVWQRTKTGTKVLNEWEASRNGSSREDRG